jgi:hypothetical protein
VSFGEPRQVPWPEHAFGQNAVAEARREAARMVMVDFIVEERGEVAAEGGGGGGEVRMRFQ